MSLAADSIRDAEVACEKYEAAVAALVVTADRVVSARAKTDAMALSPAARAYVAARRARFAARAR